MCNRISKSVIKKREITKATAKKTKQCNRASKHFCNMLHTETMANVPKTVRRHINRCNFCREKLIALQTETITAIDKMTETRQTLETPMKERGRLDIKSKSLFVRLKTKILAILLQGKREA